MNMNIHINGSSGRDVDRELVISKSIDMGMVNKKRK